MKQSQNVTDYPNNNTIFMVWKFIHQEEAKTSFEKLCALVGNLNNSYNIRVPDGKTSCVMGIGHDAWIKLGLPLPLPKELVNFETIAGAKHTAISTAGDLHFHLRASNAAVCFDMAIAITKVLGDVAECLEEVHGFRYWDGRSIIGFVDGTENPVGEEREHFALVGDEDPVYKGGSYLFVQKYFHNMKNWESLTTEEQEKVIGRSKMDDIEMDDDVKPANSHSALTAITDENGNELKIVRDNMPFGNPSKGEIGTYFISYASTFSTTKKMLENMFIGDPVGNYDRILDFSTAQTGTLFFVPTLDVLDEYGQS
ncbi:MAG: Dyp-type peroxidase [Flavobacterium sp.]|uniref:Dyp-type peroxidase n=1 Tax=Flavobacterium sp. TaxID=239 RepID=UPI001AFEC9D1|nr:Dyp-type peroxidase [Flavobacterium sp.]MBO9584808.1 Dyp-type peroxidase [Flavobacterium sp.]